MPAQDIVGEWVPVGDLVPWDQNPRDNDQSVDEVAGSIKRFGFAAPIIARRADSMVIAGHTRLKAAQRLGINKVPVRWMDLDPSEARMLALADNKLNERADWDDDLLSGVLAQLQEDGADLEGLGWDDDELSGILDGLDSTENVLVDDQYTTKIEVPTYEPTGPRPHLDTLIDTSVTDKLLNAIDKAGLPDDIAEFLRHAAHRHTVFNFQRVANYYAHAEADLQRLMEDSALVIIDFDRAIEQGFIRLSEQLVALAGDEVSDIDA